MSTLRQDPGDRAIGLLGESAISRQIRLASAAKTENPASLMSFIATTNIDQQLCLVMVINKKKFSTPSLAG